MTQRVAITQPYVPGYRERLWELVIQELGEARVECRVFYGGDRSQHEEIAVRGDGIEPRWASRVRAWTFRPSRRIPKFMFRRIPASWSGADVLLVTEMQGTNLNAWQRLALRRPYITLGHGLSETTTQSQLADLVENRLNQHASHVLTYTDSGRRHVLRSTRLDPARVTAFRNSTDTSRLERAMAAVDPARARAFRESHGIPDDASVALFLGALNEYKKIDLLVDAARVAMEADPSVWLVVAGDGTMRASVDALAADTGRVVMLGHSTPEDYAPAASVSRLLLNPGRVGLVAVDALVMGLPVLTSSGAAHAPEYEYLTRGLNVFEAEATPEAYARAWMETNLHGAAAEVGHPTIEAAAQAISGAILGVISRTER
jgi:glycosyltransferase involved in cell wall biosynthesis